MKRRLTENQIHGKHSLEKLFRETAGKFAEVMVYSGETASPLINLFGRKVDVLPVSDISQVFGAAAAGLRSSALLDSDQAELSMPLFSELSRNHIPFSCIVTGNALSLLPQFADAGCIVYQCRDNQCISDRLLAGQVLSERLLTPFVILVPNLSDSSYEIPDDTILRKWLGDPDSRIASITPAQKMLHGQARRQMPAWIHPDVPLLIGSKKEKKGISFEKAAQSVFEKQHWPEIISNTFDEFSKITNRAHQAISYFGHSKWDYLLYTLSDPNPLKELSTERLISKKNIGIAWAEQLFPLPLPDGEKLKRVSTITVLEPVFSKSREGWLNRELSALQQLSSMFRINSFYRNEPDIAALLRCVEHMLQKNKATTPYWLDVPFTVDNSAYPKHKAYLQEVQRSYPDVSKHSLATTNGLQSSNQTRHAAAPDIIRKIRDGGPPYSRVSSFFDHTACFYENEEGELAADPSQSLSVIPAATANFIGGSETSRFPEFKPTLCTACGDCISACPYSAIEGSYFSIPDLLDHAVKSLQKKGEQISAIVPLQKALASKAAKLLKDHQGDIDSISDLLSETMVIFCSEKSFDPEKEQKLKEEWNSILVEFGDQPVSLSEEWYLSREKVKRGNGLLFSLNINLSSCTGCGICSEVCEPDALSPTSTDISAIKSVGMMGPNLPATSSKTLDRLLQEDGFDPFVALLLNTTARKSISGGAVHDENSPARTIINLFAASLDERCSTRHTDLSKELQRLATEIDEVVLREMGKSMPSDRLEGLRDVLSRHREERLGADKLMREWGQMESFRQVDKADLQNRLELAESLKNWAKAIQEGPSGLGRSGFSIVLDDSLSEMAKYPWNNFTVPVLFTGKSDPAATALGVFKGQLRHSLDHIRLLRRADLEIKGKYEPRTHNPQIAGLNWDQLTTEEKQLVNPVIVLARSEMIADNRMSFIKLLNSGFPIKVLILEQPGIAADEIIAGSNSLWEFMTLAKSYVSRQSLSSPKLLFRSFGKALDYDGSSVVAVLCPDPFLFDINPKRWSGLNGLAVSSRAFNPIEFIPDPTAKSFASSLSTAGIPRVADDWTKTQLQYINYGEEAALEYKVTWADWAFMMNAWKSSFKKVEEKDEYIPVGDFLELNQEELTDREPVILRVDKNAKLVYYAVDDQVISICRTVQKNFRLMRELAGLFTLYPEKLKNLVTEDLDAKYSREQAAFIADLEEQKTRWKDEHLNEIKASIKERLMALSASRQ